jgi:hypothetical protein
VLLPRVGSVKSRSNLEIGLDLGRLDPYSGWSMARVLEKSFVGVLVARKPVR